jgi:hypothetical protein
VPGKVSDKTGANPAGFDTIRRLPRRTISVKNLTEQQRAADVPAKPAPEPELPWAKCPCVQYAASIWFKPPMRDAAKRRELISLINCAAVIGWRTAMRRATS